MNRRLRPYLPTARKLAVAAAGFSVLAAGVGLIVLPGPAVIVIRSASRSSRGSFPGRRGCSPGSSVSMWTATQQRCRTLGGAARRVRRAPPSGRAA